MGGVKKTLNAWEIEAKYMTHKEKAKYLKGLEIAYEIKLGVDYKKPISTKMVEKIQKIGIKSYNECMKIANR